MEAEVEKILNIYHLEIVPDDRSTKRRIGQICPRSGGKSMSSDFMAVSLTSAPCTFRTDLKRVIKNTYEN